MKKNNQQQLPSQEQDDELFKDQVLRLIPALRDSNVATVEAIIDEGFDTVLCGEGLHNQLAFVLICLLHQCHFLGVSISTKEIEDKVRICELLILHASQVCQFTDSALVRAVTQFRQDTKINAIMGPLKRETFSFGSLKIAAPKQVIAFEPEFLMVIQRIQQAYQTRAKALTEKSDEAYQDLLDEIEKEEKKHKKKQKKKNKPPSKVKKNHSQAVSESSGSNPKEGSITRPESMSRDVPTTTPDTSSMINQDKRLSIIEVDKQDPVSTSTIDMASSSSTTPISSTNSSSMSTPLATPSTTRGSSPTPDVSDVEELIVPSQLGLFANKLSAMQEKYYAIRGCHLGSHNTLYPFFFSAVKVTLSQQAYGDQIVGLQFLTHAVESRETVTVYVKLPNEIEGLYFDEWVEIDGKKFSTELYRPINFSLLVSNLENYFNSGLFFYQSALQACQESHLEVSVYKTLLLKTVFDLSYSRKQAFGFYGQPMPYYRQLGNTMEPNFEATLSQLTYGDLYQAFLGKLDKEQRQQFCQVFTPSHGTINQISVHDNSL